jgi:hypothetical protein
MRGDPVLCCVAALAGLAGCNDPPTSVRLLITTAYIEEPIDGLAVTMQQTRHEAEMTNSLQILVPDAWAGTPQRFDVEGLHGGIKAAIGYAVVTPAEAREVTAVVTLVEPHCGLECSAIGAPDCDGDRVVTCELGSDNCPRWSAPVSCPSEAPYCSNGSCSDQCSDQCGTDATVCASAEAIRVCGQFDKDICLEWGPPTDCGLGEVCQGDACVPGCSTSISGRVFAPNATLPLSNVVVYVPIADPGPFPEGVQCSQCSSTLPGGSLARAISDASGAFRLRGVPAGQDFTVVITTGKWRRKVTVPAVEACQDTAIVDGTFRLPRTRNEGDIPSIAVTTGDADALECLLRKIGIADSQFTNESSGGRVQLYAGDQGTSSYWDQTTEVALSPASDLWASLDKLKRYDIALFSCEGDQNPDQGKSQAAMDNVKAYADAGGRLFLSHHHSIWIQGSTTGGGTQKPAVWPALATWAPSSHVYDGNDMIDERTGVGVRFATWMLHVMGSPPGDRGVVPIDVTTGRQSCTGVDSERAERWVSWSGNGTGHYTQAFQFTTPNERPAPDRCGKVVFTDIHMSLDSDSFAGPPFPDQCSDAAMSPQEKALAFMLFELAACVEP